MSNTYNQIRDRIKKLKETASQNKASYLKRIKQVTFEFAPFSPKQKKILTWWCGDSPVKDSDGIIADGAIRSGKTVSMSLSYGLWAMTNFNRQNFLICGKTIGSLRRNVIFWWKIMMRSQGFIIREVRTDNLLIVTRGENINYFYLFGGKDERSQDLVQGITAAGVLFDEVALMPESFVNQATGRCSIDGSKFWFNCNPEGPGHWFKVNWIDKLKCNNKGKVPESGEVYKDIIYLHFTMDDNLSLSEKIKERYRSMYSGLFFKRLIMGLWCIASGVIYDMFDEEKHIIKGDTSRITGRRYYVVDYGTINPMVFLEIIDDGISVSIVKENYYDSKKEYRQKTDKEYADDLLKFIDGKEYRWIIIDPSAASFKAEMHSKGIRRIQDADNTVLDGIRMVATLLNLQLLKVHESCVNTINEFYNYVWNEKAAERGVEEPVKQSDHAMDCIRYMVYTALKGRRFTRRE